MLLHEQEGEKTGSAVTWLERFPVVASTAPPSKEGVLPHAATHVYFNDGTNVNAYALVIGGGGDVLDLAQIPGSGESVTVHYGVGRREPTEYGPEGGGNTWHDSHYTEAAEAPAEEAPAEEAAPSEEVVAEPVAEEAPAE